MKNLIQLTTAVILLVQTLGYCQTNGAETILKNQDSISVTKQINTKIDTKVLESFVGEYMLAEAGFTLEIVKEADGMYIISPFSKDILIQKNSTTLFEITRGVYLSLIEGNKNALEYTQNGYVTTIKRVKSTTEK